MSFSQRVVMNFAYPVNEPDIAPIFGPIVFEEQACVNVVSITNLNAKALKTVKTCSHTSIYVYA